MMSTCCESLDHPPVFSNCSASSQTTCSSAETPAFAAKTKQQVKSVINREGMFFVLSYDKGEKAKGDPFLIFPPLIHFCNLFHANFQPGRER